MLGLMALGATAAIAADDVGVVDSKSGVWYLRDAATGDTTSFYYGNPGDVPFVGDWDCDGVDTPGLYRQRDGYVYLRDANTQGNADTRFYFGDPGDVPVAGDFNGDGCDTVSIYRPSLARFYIINALGENDRGLGAADFAFTFGNVGDSPLAGDWDSDGIHGVGVVRAGSGSAYLTNALKAGPPASTVEIPGDDVPVVGKWAAADALAGYQQSSGTYKVPGDEPLQYGNAHTAPIAGEFGALQGGSEAPAPPPPYPDIGDGKRIIYSNSEQRVWLIDKDNLLVDTYLVSGRIGIPHDGTYSVYSKSVNAWAPYGGITMKHMVRFVRPGTWGNQWAYGFHSIPRYANGTPMQTEAQMGTHRSGGCVRQPDAKAYALFQWADIGTTVHAIP
jgi:lipoprotein-anchoring transpeptidase ErfK/SrfK